MVRLSSSAARYALALLATSAASLLYLWSGPVEVESDIHYFGFILAVLFSALAGGIGPGMLATALSALVSAYLLLPPVHSLQVSSHDQTIRLILFCGEGLLLSCVGHIFRANVASEVNIASNGTWMSRYVPVFLFVSTAVGLKLLAYRDVERELPFTFFYVAIAASAWTGGIAPGLLAMFLSAVAAAFLFLVPQSSVPLRAPENVERITLFAVEGTLIAALSAAYPHARRIANRAVVEMRRYSRRAHRTLEDMRALRLTSQDLIWEWDLTSNRITFGATKAERPETSVATTSLAAWLDEIHPDDRASVAKSLSRILTEDRNDWMCDYRRLNPAGESLYMSDRGYVLRDSEGRATRVVGRSADVTESKHMANLVAFQRRYRTVFEQSPVAILVADRQFHIGSANCAATDLLGYDEAQLKEMRIETLFEMPRRAIVLKTLRGLSQEQGRSVTFREQCIPLSADSFEAKVTAAAVAGVDDGSNGFVITIEKFDEHS